MDTYAVDEVPTVGDLVRQHGRSQVMAVQCGALGEKHSSEGVQNGVYCTWEADGEEQFEVYPASQLVIVLRNSR